MNAIKPKANMKPPKELCGIEWPEMNVLFLSLNRSILGPNMIAPEIIWNDLVVLSTFHH